MNKVEHCIYSISELMTSEASEDLVKQYAI